MDRMHQFALASYEFHSRNPFFYGNSRQKLSVYLIFSYFLAIQLRFYQLHLFCSSIKVFDDIT